MFLALKYSFFVENLNLFFFFYFIEEVSKSFVIVIIVNVVVAQGERNFSIWNDISILLVVQ